MSEKLCKTCREADGGPHICNNDKIDIILFDRIECECKKCDEKRVIRKYLNSFSMVEDEIIYRFLEKFPDEGNRKSIMSFLHFEVELNPTTKERG